MAEYCLTVSPAAIAQLWQLRDALQDNASQLRRVYDDLLDTFRENMRGLGPHTDSIRLLLEEMELAVCQSCHAMDRLALKLHTSAMYRQSLVEASPYKTTQTDRDIAKFRAQLYETYYRKLRQPKTRDTQGNIRGCWDGDIFVPDPNFIPGKHNPGNQSFAQLQQQLWQSYGIALWGIPYVDGYADFSGIALAQVEKQAIESARLQKSPGLAPNQLFSDRSANAACADSLAATRGLPIPGLPASYTAAQLKKWRGDNGFSWEESMHHGYLLVPSVIHGNISHTGLVGLMTADETYTRRFAEHLRRVAGTKGALRLNVDGIGKNIYTGKGFKLYRK